MSAIAEYLDSLRGKSIAVIGMGVSNTPLIRMLLRANLKVTICDKSPRERVEEQAAELESLGAKLQLGSDYLAKIHKFDVIFRTPGLSPNTPELVEAVFRREAPMPAAAQKETFQTLLSDTLADECSCEVVQAVHDQLCELVEEHRERKEAEPLTLSKGAVKCVLKSCGVSDSHVEEFALRYDDAFGADMALSPRNLVEKQIEVCTPDVVIKVSPERSDLVDTRVIDGVKYILIRADEGVEVNGVPVHIAE